MVRIQAPATTANLGAGFDCLGCALSLYNTYEIEEIEQGVEITGCEVAYANENNLVVRAYREAMRRMSLPLRGLRVHIESQIPLARGLGSSAACISAGVLAASLLHGGGMDERALLSAATAVEGHPDNVAPCLLGGLTASMMEGEQAFSVRYRVHESIRFCALVPDFELSTERARAVLPAQVPFRDAVYNLSRAAVFARAMETGDVRTLAAALSDRLHQPYRKPLLREYDAVRERALSCGAFGFCVSGAGPTLLALYTGDAFLPRIQHALTPLQNHWQALPLAVGDGAKEVRRGDEG